jgi:hypothetical protein
MSATETTTTPTAVGVVIKSGPAFIPRAAAKVAEFAGAIGKHPPVVKVALFPDGTFRLEATDKEAAVVVRGESHFPTGGNLIEDRLVAEPNGARSIFVKASDVLAAFKVVCQKETAFKAGVKLGAEQAAFAGHNATARIHAQAVPFPDLTAFVPKARPAATVKVDPRLLAKVLRTCGEMGCRSVTLVLWGGDRPLAVVGTGDSYLCVEAVVAPMFTAAGKTTKE